MWVRRMEDDLSAALDFTGRTVLVVGGSSGIGNAMAQLFRASGAEAHVWGTRRSAGDYSAAEGSNLEGLHYARVDVSHFSAIEAAPTPPKLDVLICCQGTVLYKRQEFEDAGFQKVVDVNLTSIMACARKFKPLLMASKGSLITVSSTAAYHSTKGNPAYAASKAGAVALTRTLGEAWAPDGIRVNGIAPGLVATKLTKVTTDNPERLAASLQKIPLARLGKPEEIAGAALFLASPLASYVCGQTIVVDGGLLL